MILQIITQFSDEMFMLLGNIDTIRYSILYYIILLSQYILNNTTHQIRVSHETM
jgi:hypothetical protein